MAKALDMYKCDLCGHIIEVFLKGDGELVCCGKPMQFLAENTVDASKEKHVPAIEKIDGGYLVKVGSVAHPMEEAHYIQWIELVAGNYVIRKMLKPGEKPEAEFTTNAQKVTAREYCNLHGLWKTEIN